MRISFFKIASLFFLLIFFDAGAQTDPYVDSLKRLLQNKKIQDTAIIRLKMDIGQEAGIYRIGYWDTLAKECDTFLVKTKDASRKNILLLCKGGILNNQGYIYKNSGDPTMAGEKYEEGLVEYDKVKYVKDTVLRNRVITEKAQTINNLATLFVETGNVSKGKEYHLKSLELRKEVNDQEGIALSYNNLGYVTNSQGNMKEALQYFFESLKIREAIEDWKGLGQVYGNIAAIYNKQYGTKKAIEYHRKAMFYWTKAKSNTGVALALNNIGTCHLKENSDDSAMYYYEKALQIRVEMNYKKGEGNSYYNIANVQAKQHKFDEALVNYKKSLEILTEVKDKVGVIHSLQKLSELYMFKGNNTEAIKTGETSFKMSKEMGFVEEMKNSSLILYNLYSKSNNINGALKMYVLHIRLRDSISNIENQKEALTKQFEFQYEKKAAADSVRMEKEKEVNEAKLAVRDEQIKREATMRYALFGGLALTLIFGGLVFNRYRLTQKQKIVIEQQKHLVEEKQKEILDSIHYARRIQSALLASESYIGKTINRLMKK
jgi:tetratricopeptide (TPR) repeat protein